MEVTKTTFTAQHCPITLTNKAVFSELFSTKDGKTAKRVMYNTKADWLVWKKSVTQEIAVQNKLSQACPDHVLGILDYTVEVVNHKRLLYITYDCDTSSKSLLQYIQENDVPYKEQINMCEKLLQIANILHHSEYFHGNLKPNNVIYYKKKVLISDFGSARTHYWNFTKEHTGQKEKEWRNNFLFFCPQQYLEIMNEENIDFRDDYWRSLNMNDTQLRKKADLWAIGIMILQVFENNQNLSQDIQQYYGLNQSLIQQKLHKLGETQRELIEIAVRSLIIDWQDPKVVLQHFQKQKMLINQKHDNLMISETTSNFYQVFDTLKPELQLEPGVNQNYYYSKEELEQLRQQHEMDDKSSVRSDNTQNIENARQIYQSDGIFKSQHLLVVDDNTLTASQQIQRYSNQPVILESTNPKVLYAGDTGPSRTGAHKPSIKLSGPEEYRQQPPEPWKITNNLQIIEDDEEKHIFINKQMTSQFDIPHDDEEQQGLMQVTDPNEEYGNKKFQSSSQEFKFNTSSKLQVITDNQNNTVIPSFGALKSGKFELEKKQQENSMRLQQVDDELNGRQIDQWNSGKINLNQENGQKLTQVNDFLASKQSLVSVGQIAQGTDRLEQEKQKGQDLNQVFETMEQQQLFQFSGNLENVSACFPEAAKLEQVSDKIENNEKPEKTQIIKSDLILENEKQQIQPTRLVDQPSKIERIANTNPQVQEENDIIKPYQLLQETTTSSKPGTAQSAEIQKNGPQELQIEGHQRFQPTQIVDQPQDRGKQTNINPIGKFQIEQQTNLSQINQPNLPLNKIVPIQYDGPTLSELLKKTDLTEMKEEELQKRKTTLEAINEILSQVTDGIQPLLNENEGESDNKHQISQLINQITQINSRQQQQTLIEVQEQLDAIKEKQKADKFFYTNEIEKNPQLLNQLSEEQLNQLKNKLKSKKDPENKALLDKIQELKKIKEKLNQALQKPSVSSLLKPDELGKLNSQQLTQYKENLTKLAGTTKSNQQRNQIFQQQQAIEKILEKVRLDKLIQKFIDNPKTDTLLSSEEYAKLNEEQRQAYKEALERFLPNAPGRFGKAIEKALAELKKIMKPASPQNIKPIPINEHSSEGTAPDNDAALQIGQGGGDYSWNSQLDWEVLSLNKIIRAYQKTPYLYMVEHEIPQNFKEIVQNKKDGEKKNYNQNTFGGYWLNGMPHGIGTMMEGKNYSIYKGVFEQGKFVWGQVLELNNQGMLTQYIGKYDKIQEKQSRHTKKGEMKWFKYSYQNCCCSDQINFQEVESYVGNFLYGQIHGQGQKTNSDGSSYKGQFVKNKREGKGEYVLIEQDKYFKYRGEFKNDLFHGEGVVSYDKIDKLTQRVEYQNGKLIREHSFNLIWGKS